MNGNKRFEVRKKSTPKGIARLVKFVKDFARKHRYSFNDMISL